MTKEASNVKNMFLLKKKSTEGKVKEMLNCLKKKKALFKWGEINLTFCTIESLSLDIKNLDYFSYFFNLNMKLYFYEF